MYFDIYIVSISKLVCNTYMYSRKIVGESFRHPEKFELIRGVDISNSNDF